MLNINRKIKSGNILPHLKFKLESVKSERFVRLRLLTSGTNKSNFIKMLSVLLVLSLLSLISLLPVLSSRAYEETYPSLNGITYLNMPEKTFGGKTTECKLTITNLNLNNNKLNLSGILSYSSRNYYLNIEGTLYKSRIGKNNFVALAKDTTNTFNVLHLSILFNPNPHFLITKRMKNELSNSNASFNHSPVITVYLQRKGTREISFAEGTMHSLSLIRKQSLVEFATTISNGFNGFDSVYYTSLIFKPLHVSYSTYNSQIEQKTFSYYETYTANSQGDTYTYFIEYTLTQRNYGSTSVNTDSSNKITRVSYPIESNFKITIDENYTYSSNPIYSSDTSPLIIGGPDDPVEIKVKVGGNESQHAVEEIVEGGYNGMFCKFHHWYDGINVYAGLSYGIFSISWNPSEYLAGTNIRPNTSYIIEYRNMENGEDGTYTKLADFPYKGLYIKDQNQYFDCHIKTQPVLHTSVYPYDRYISGQWTVPIYARYSVFTGYTKRVKNVFYLTTCYHVTRN